MRHWSAESINMLLCQEVMKKANMLCLHKTIEADLLKIFDQPIATAVQAISLYGAK